MSKLLENSKKFLCTLRKGYKKRLESLHFYLDNELNYLDSQFHYTEQTYLKKSKMEYTTSSFSKKISPLNELSSKELQELFSVCKKISEDTVGVIIEKEKLTDINIFIAQMNKMQIKNRRANFFVVTDCANTLLHLYNVFNWMHKKSYVIPNVQDPSFDSSVRDSIIFHALTQLDRCISTAAGKYTSILKENDVRVSIPRRHKVFCFNCKSIIPE